MNLIVQAINRVIDDQAYKHIFHLARHAKKRRTRTKNLRRIGYYIWKEIVNG